MLHLACQDGGSHPCAPSVTPLPITACAKPDEFTTTRSTSEVENSPVSHFDRSSHKHRYRKPIWFNSHICFSNAKKSTQSAAAAHSRHHILFNPAQLMLQATRRETTVKNDKRNAVQCKSLQSTSKFHEEKPLVSNRDTCIMWQCYRWNSVHSTKTRTRCGSEEVAVSPQQFE